MHPGAIKCHQMPPSAIKCHKEPPNPTQFTISPVWHPALADLEWVILLLHFMFNTLVTRHALLWFHTKTCWPTQPTNPTQFTISPIWHPALTDLCFLFQIQIQNTAHLFGILLWLMDIWLIWSSHAARHCTLKQEKGQNYDQVKLRAAQVKLRAAQVKLWKAQVKLRAAQVKLWYLLIGALI